MMQAVVHMIDVCLSQDPSLPCSTLPLNQRVIHLIDHSLG